MLQKLFILSLPIILIFIIASIAAIKKKGYIAFMLVFLAMLVIYFISTTAMYGLRHTWEIILDTGKALAVLIAVSFPLVLAALPILILHNKNIRPVYIGVISFILSYPGVINIPVIALTLICDFTGDCLWIFSFECLLLAGPRRNQLDL